MTMLPLLLLIGGAAGFAYIVSRESVPEGALPGCSFNEVDLAEWGRRNNIGIVVDGVRQIGAREETNLLHWATGSRVLMTRDSLSADWIAVNSYCRFNLAQGRGTSDQPISIKNINPNNFKLVDKVNASILAGGFKPL